MDYQLRSVALCRAAKEPTRELELFTSENNTKKKSRLQARIDTMTWLPDPLGRPRGTAAARGERYSLLTRISGVAMTRSKKYNAKPQFVASIKKKKTSTTCYGAKLRLQKIAQ